MTAKVDEMGTNQGNIHDFDERRLNIRRCCSTSAERDEYNVDCYDFPFSV